MFPSQQPSFFYWLVIKLKASKAVCVFQKTKIFISLISPYMSIFFCLFQPEYSYADGDGTVPAESAKVKFLTIDFL